MAMDTFRSSSRSSSRSACTAWMRSRAVAILKASPRGEGFHPSPIGTKLRLVRGAAFGHDICEKVFTLFEGAQDEHHALALSVEVLELLGRIDIFRFGLGLERWPLVRFVLVL